MKKVKLSDKDYLLALGILVAIIVMLISMMNTDVLSTETKNRQTPAQRKTGLTISPAVLLKKVIERVDLTSFLPKNPS